MQHLSHKNAFEYWNTVVPMDFFAEKIIPEKPPTFLVRSNKERFFNAKGSTYVYTGALPDDALDDSVGVVSPYLMYMQMAKYLNLHEMIILGYLLCAQSQESRYYTFIRKDNLVKFVKAATNYPGRKKALLALPHVKDGAASIMEIFLHLFLGLPNHLGRLGLKGGVFNYGIALNDAGKKALKQNICYVDYYFPEKKVGFEYQGMFHNDSMDSDAVRFAALKHLGHDVLNVTKIQVYNPAIRQQFFQVALDMLDQKLQIRTEKYSVNLQYLHRILPRGSNQNRIMPSSNREQFR